jgi:hypothetical protein
VVTLQHKHELKKTQLSFIEFDDVVLDRLSDLTYFGEGNSKGRKMTFTFEYCLDCDLRLYNDQLILTNGVFAEFEKLVSDAKNSNYVKVKEVTVPHSDYDILERLIKNALELGKLKQFFLNKQV